MARNIDSIKTTVKNLLDRAADQAGTPEGDACLERAATMMAKYAFDERDLAADDAQGDIEHVSIPLSGAYTNEQLRLAALLASALHCEAVGMMKPRSRVCASVEVFGRPEHIRRVEMLFSVLNPKMIVEANAYAEKKREWYRSEAIRLNPAAYREFGLSWIMSKGETMQMKRSFMRAFAEALYSKINQAERKVVGESKAVMVAGDKERANEAYNTWLEERNMRIRHGRSQTANDPEAYHAGFETGERQDVGQQRMEGTKALAA